MSVPASRFALGPAEIHVWWITIRHGVALTETLSVEERTRAARFHQPRDSARWIATRAALRHILSCYTGIAPRTLQLTYGRFGKPALDGGSPYRFSMTHAGDRAALAVALQRDVGIDLEPPAARDWATLQSLLAVCCAPAEAARIAALPDSDRAGAFLTVWTMKEAYLKATGLGLARDPRAMEIDVQAGGRALVHDALAADFGRPWTVLALDAGGAWAAALAYGGTTAEVIFHAWPTSAAGRAPGDMPRVRQAE